MTRQRKIPWSCSRNFAQNEPSSMAKAGSKCANRYQRTGALGALLPRSFFQWQKTPPRFSDQAPDIFWKVWSLTDPPEHFSPFQVFRKRTKAHFDLRIASPWVLGYEMKHNMSACIKSLNASLLSTCFSDFHISLSNHYTQIPELLPPSSRRKAKPASFQLTPQSQLWS